MDLPLYFSTQKGQIPLVAPPVFQKRRNLKILSSHKKSTSCPVQGAEMTHNPPMRIPISSSDKAWARLSGGKIAPTNTTSAELPRRPWDAV